MSTGFCIGACAADNNIFQYFDESKYYTPTSTLEGWTIFSVAVSKYFL